jgi:DNA-binding response OmpR family regulator
LTNSTARDEGDEGHAMDTKKRILIVDDEQINLDFFDVMLSKLGFLVGKAENGEEALEEVRRFKPDLIMLDNIMPKLSGWEVTRILKNREDFREFSDIPIIMFSAMDDVKDKVEGFELGIDDYITKPYNFSEVLARIRSHLRTRELVIQLEKRETRIALAEKLDAGLLDFCESLKKPMEALASGAGKLSGLSGDAAAYVTKAKAEASDILSRLTALGDTIAKLKEEESRLKKSEIELHALRSQAFRKG